MRKLCNAVNLHTITCYKSVKRMLIQILMFIIFFTKFSTKNGEKLVTVQVHINFF